MTDASATTTRRAPHGGAALAGVLTLALTLTGCTDSGEPTQTQTPSRTPTAGSSSPEAPVTDPDQALRQQADQVRTAVDDLTGLAPGVEWVVNLDSRSVCGTPTGEPWPAQWNYSRTTLTPSGTPVGVLTDHLTKDGWRVTSQDDGGTASVDRTVVQREGSLLILQSTTTDDVVGIIGNSACVNADGTIDRRPVS